MSIFDSSPSGYWVQEPKAPEGVLAELREFGINHPVQPYDGLDESMPPEALRIIVQVGCEMLANLAGMGIGDYLTADIINRGLLERLRQRKAEREAAGMGA
jgi:hypothetical protein